jgi:Holliday junction resolvase-like predicted endonuclease
LGAKIGPHPEFGRVDVVAKHPSKGLCLVEVEGESSRQKEQALYSALGQLVLQMRGASHAFMLAVPDSPQWDAQIKKVPTHVRTALGLSCVLVSEHGVREP